MRRRAGRVTHVVKTKKPTRSKPVSAVAPHY
jgi:hypothetical protein